MNNNVEVIPIAYSGMGKVGDFAWMQSQPDYANTLFVFNDNEEQFDAFLNGTASGFTAGGGNAIARPWRKLDPAKSAGIPTGSLGSGYSVLDAKTQAKIDQALQIIDGLLKLGSYDKLVFSADQTLTTLGTGIFNVCDAVRNYIFESLMKLA
jgi:hypothetical protein